MKSDDLLKILIIVFLVLFVAKILYDEILVDDLYASPTIAPSAPPRPNPAGDWIVASLARNPDYMAGSDCICPYRYGGIGPDGREVIEVMDGCLNIQIPACFNRKCFVTTSQGTTPEDCKSK